MRWKTALLSVLIALLVGTAGGYVLGYLEKRECQKDSEAAHKRLAEVETTVAALKADAEKGRTKELTIRTLLSCKTNLLEALINMNQKNFGLAEKHLEAAETKLVQISPKLTEGPAKRMRSVADAIAKIKDQATRLDAGSAAKLETLVRQIPDENAVR